MESEAMLSIEIWITFANLVTELNEGGLSLGANPYLPTGYVLSTW